MQVLLDDFMSDETPIPDSTGQAPATPESSVPEAPQAQAVAPVAAAPVIPEKYEFTLGEGRSLVPELIDAVSPVFKELGLTQDNAGKLVGAYDKVAQALEAKAESDFQAFMKKTAESNIAAIKKEWGNEYDTNMPVANRAIARFLSDNAKKALEDSGLGNNPEFVKAFYQIGKMIQEDQPPAHIGGSMTEAQKVKSLYPNSNLN